MVHRRQTPQAVVVAVSAAVAALTLGACNSSSAPPVPLSITSGSPPNGTVGTAYTFTLTSTDGEGGYGWSWQASPGSTLPPGLSIQCEVLTPPGAGCNQPQAISGVPTAAGTYKVVVTVSDFVLSANDIESTPQRTSATSSIGIAP